MGFPTIPVRGFTFTSSTLADFGEGIETGDVAFDNKGRSFVFVKANGTIADGSVCRPVNTQTTTADSELLVVVADAITDVACCANNTGGSISSGTYFWGIMTGRGYALGGAAIGDGLDMMHHTTDGTVGPVAGGGATSQHLGYTISDVATDVNNAVFWDLPSKRPIA